jgi:hypothetical protein
MLRLMPPLVSVVAGQGAEAPITRRYAAGGDVEIGAALSAGSSLSGFSLWSRTGSIAGQRAIDLSWSHPPRDRFTAPRAGDRPDFVALKSLGHGSNSTRIIRPIGVMR